MTTELLHVGFGNFIALNRVIAVVSAEAAPTLHMVREGKKRGTVITLTAGRRTKAAIYMDSGQIVLSALTPETISSRVASKKDTARVPAKVSSGAPTIGGS